MSLNTIWGDTHFPDNLSMGSVSLPDECITKENIESNAGIEASKLQHQHVIQYNQKSVADTVAAETMVVHICRGEGSIVSVEVTSSVAPTADTDYFTVDVKRVRSGTGHSVLSSAITYNNTNAKAGDGGDASGNYGIVVGTIDGSYDDLEDNDVLEVEIGVVNNGGTNASGCCVTITIREAA